MKLPYLIVLLIGGFLAIAAVAIIISSSSAPPRVDKAEQGPREVPTATTATTASTVTQLPMPEQTVFVVSINPQRGAAFLKRALPYLPDTDAGALPDAPTLARLLAAGLVSGELLYQPHAIFEGLEQDDALGLDALDSSRSIVVAVSARGNDEELNLYRNGVPLAGMDGLFHGLSMRVFLPASDAEQLRRQLEQDCESPSSCRHVRRFETKGDSVVLDIHRATISQAFDAYDDVDLTYWQRQTPALSAFLKAEARADVAFAFYQRSEDLPIWGAMAGSLEMVEALARATPQNRDFMIARGAHMIGSVFTLSSPEVREFEDICLAVGSAEASDLLVDAYRTFTKKGAAISRAGATTRTLQRRSLERPLVEFSWVRGNEIDSTLLAPPGWMVRLSQNRDFERNFDEVFQTGGLWNYAIVALTYPQAFGAGLGLLSAPEPDSPWASWQRWHDVAALQGSLNWIVDDAAPLGGSPAGSASLLVPDNPKWTALIKSGHEFMQQMTHGNMSFRTEKQGDKVLVAVTLGAPGSGPTATDVKAGSHDIQLDLAGLASLIEHGAIPNLEVAPGLLPALRKSETAHFRHREFEQGTSSQLYLGAAPLGELRFPGQTVGLVQPDGNPACLEELRDSSRRTAHDYSHDPMDRRPMGPLPTRSVWDDLREAQTCEPDNPAVVHEINWIRSRWRGVAGRMVASGFDMDRALLHFEEACALGHERACADAERTRSVQQEVRPARVTPTSATKWASVGLPLPLLTRRGLSWLEFGAAQPDETRKVTSLAELRRDAAEASGAGLGPLGNVSTKRIDFDGGRDVQAAIFAADRGTSSELVALAIELTAARDTSEMRRKDPLVAGGELRTAFIVDTSDILNWMVLFTGAKKLKEGTNPRIDLVITRDGIQLRGAGMAVPAVAGCPADGPTICVAGSPAALIAQILDPAGDVDEDGIKSLAALYRLDMLAEQVTSLSEVVFPRLGRDFYQPPPTQGAPTFVIHAETAVPFALLAEIHTTIGQWADEHRAGAQVWIGLE